MKNSTKKVVGVGAGVLTAAAVAAAAAYFLSDQVTVKKGKAKVNAWVELAKKEVAKNMKVAKNLGEEEYLRLVDQAMKHYGNLKDASAVEILQAAKEMKSEWKRIRARAEEELAKQARPAKKKAKKASRG